MLTWRAFLAGPYRKGGTGSWNEHALTFPCVGNAAKKDKVYKELLSMARRIRAGRVHVVCALRYMRGFIGAQVCNSSKSSSDAQ